MGSGAVRVQVSTGLGCGLETYWGAPPTVKIGDRLVVRREPVGYPHEAVVWSVGSDEPPVGGVLDVLEELEVELTDG